MKEKYRKLDAILTMRYSETSQKETSKVLYHGVPEQSLLGHTIDESNLDGVGYASCQARPDDKIPDPTSIRSGTLLDGLGRIVNPGAVKQRGMSGYVQKRWSSCKRRRMDRDKKESVAFLYYEMFPFPRWKPSKILELFILPASHVNPNLTHGLKLGWCNLYRRKF